MLKLLFLCSQNKLRSPTAEHVFSKLKGVECDSAGLHESADVYLSPEQLHWADIVFVMETAHKTKLSKKFKRHLDGKRVIVLNIRDEYDYMDAELVQMLEKKVKSFLPTR